MRVHLRQANYPENRVIATDLQNNAGARGLNPITARNNDLEAVGVNSDTPAIHEFEALLRDLKRSESTINAGWVAAVAARNAIQSLGEMHAKRYAVMMARIAAMEVAIAETESLANSIPSVIQRNRLVAFRFDALEPQVDKLDTSAVKARVLEAISGTAQPVASICGIYFLLRDEEVVYVGQSTNVVSRIGSHLKGGEKKFERWVVMPCDAARLSAVEAYYISLFRPEYNRTLNLSVKISPIASTLEAL